MAGLNYIKFEKISSQDIYELGLALLKAKASYGKKMNVKFVAITSCKSSYSNCSRDWLLGDYKCVYLEDNVSYKFFELTAKGSVFKASLDTLRPTVTKGDSLRLFFLI